MLFNSYGFIFIFLPLCFLVYFSLSQRTPIWLSKAFLVCASLVFYGFWNPSYLPLIIISVLSNYFLAQQMIFFDKDQQFLLSKVNLLRLGLIFNVALLCYFKYMDFFIENTNMLLGTEFSLLKLTLPLAISFFTLQQIAFLVDSYEGLVKESHLLDYSIFVTFFPQLIAGPIVHHKEMMPQFNDVSKRVKNYDHIALGLYIFSIGLFKKVMIADQFAIWASAGFDTANSLGFIEAWATSLSYTFQLYFDFSGYTDMAIGSAYLFNIKLPQNFNSPYKATGMIDFWKRWHITLTNFITTYIYTPIIRSYKKLNFHKAMLATVITFLIAGLWHGASWMFVIFGGLNGVGIAVNHYWQKKLRKKLRKKLKFKLNKHFAWLITFLYVNLTFIFFRALNLEAAYKVLKGMCDVSELSLMISLPISKTQIAYIVLGFLITLLLRNTQELAEQFAVSKRNLVFTVILLSLSILSLNKVSEFLYFNF